MASMQRVLSAVLLCLTICLLTAFPPAIRAGGDEWLPINPADLALKDNPASPGSNAMILYRQERTDSEKSFLTEYIRIKIFTEEGKNQGDVKIPFAKGHDQVEDIRARTIRPDGTIVPFSGQIFEKEIVKAGGIKVSEKILTLPDVQPGCIIEYKYKLQGNTVYYWDASWGVQQDLFTRDADFSFHPPARFGSFGLNLRTVKVGQEVNLQREKNGDYAITLHDIPGLTDEEYMVPEDLLRGHIEFVFTPPSLAHLSKDAYWDLVSKTVARGFDAYVNKQEALQQVVATAVTASDSPETKLRKLYARVQTIRNLSYEDRTSQEWKREKIRQNNNVEDVLKHNYGWAREINDVFIGLARAAGFEANQVLLAPRDARVFYPEFQDASELSDDIVRVKLNGQDLYLDPAAKFYPFGILPWNETGITGLLIKDNGGFVQIPISKSSDAVVERHGALQLSDDGSLSGPVEVLFIGMRACATRQEEHAEDEVGRKKEMTDEIKSWLPSGAKLEITKISGWDDLSAPLAISGNLTILGFATSVGHRMLLPLTPFVAPEPRSFQSPDRVNDVYFPFPYQERDDFSIALPAAFSVESLPQDLPDVTDGAILYSISPAVQGRRLEVKRTLNIENSIYPAPTYVSVRQTFSLVKTGDNEQVVLQSTASARQN